MFIRTLLSNVIKIEKKIVYINLIIKSHKNRSEECVVRSHSNRTENSMWIPESKFIMKEVKNVYCKNLKVRSHNYRTEKYV